MENNKYINLSSGLLIVDAVIFIALVLNPNIAVAFSQSPKYVGYLAIIGAVLNNIVIHYSKPDMKFKNICAVLSLNWAISIVIYYFFFSSEINNYASFSAYLGILLSTLVCAVFAPVLCVKSFLAKNKLWRGLGVLLLLSWIFLHYSQVRYSLVNNALNATFFAIVYGWSIIFSLFTLISQDEKVDQTLLDINNEPNNKVSNGVNKIYNNSTKKVDDSLPKDIALVEFEGKKYKAKVLDFLDDYVIVEFIDKVISSEGKEVYILNVPHKNIITIS